jgi:mono/diheme cytochrome c family protein
MRLHMSRLAALGAAGVLWASLGLAATPDGKAIYGAKCALCHGKEGVPPPIFAQKKAPNFQDAAWHKTRTDAQLRKSISAGVSGTMMAGFASKLSAAEIDAVIAYLRKLAPEKH